jgi:hypothetical protein
MEFAAASLGGFILLLDLNPVQQALHFYRRRRASCVAWLYGVSGFFKDQQWHQRLKI